MSLALVVCYPDKPLHVQCAIQFVYRANCHAYFLLDFLAGRENDGVTSLLE